MLSNSIWIPECRPGTALTHSSYVSFRQLNAGDVLPHFGLLLLSANQSPGTQEPSVYAP